MPDPILARGPEARQLGEVRERPREETEQHDEPWAKLRVEEEERLISQYETAQQPLSAETLELGKQLMVQKIDRETIDFARHWFDDHKEELRRMGYAIPENAGGNYIVRVVKEVGGFDELKNNPDYEADNQKIEGAYALRTDLGNGAKTIESQLILMKEIGEELGSKKKQRQECANLVKEERAKKSPNHNQIRALEAQIIVLKAEADQLDKSIREVYFAINGHKPEDVAAKAVMKKDETHLDKKGYMEREEANLKASYREEKESDEQTRNAIAGRLNLRIIPVSRRFDLLGRSFELRDSDGKVIGKFPSGRLLGRHLHSLEMEKKVVQAGSKWEDDERKIKEEAEVELHDWQMAVERADGGIEAAYNRVRERLITEHIQETRKRDPKSKEQLAAIERDFKGKGLSAAEFIGAVVARKGEFAELSGNWERDQAQIKQIAENWGVPIDSREWTDFVKKQKAVYEKRVKTRRGFVDWMIDMVLSTSDQKKDNAGRQPGGRTTASSRGAGTPAGGGQQSPRATSPSSGAAQAPRRRIVSRTAPTTRPATTQQQS